MDENADGMTANSSESSKPSSAQNNTYNCSTPEQRSRWRRPEPEGPPGTYFCDTIDMFGQAAMALADRACNEAVFSEDMRPGLDPIVDGFRDQVNSFCCNAMEQIEQAPDKARTAADRALCDIGALKWLQGAKEISEKAADEGMTLTSERVGEEGGPFRLPGINVVKEVLGEVLKRVNTGSIIKGFNLGGTIQEALKVIDKLTEGSPEKPPKTTPLPGTRGG